ncbi:hypothetical protein AQUSIP_22450 [Aquicella siphonis]|uniref:Uncharacterized protein n=1 Tax=Aquicella siphonis TaxID=254247 RepID=A0A5E4PK77_9COXI|nr:hypothetical protein [Aquicella siphonis]VVC76918.1 hypothetical protein AQUSIP_22450 [Aquicella siphonis]
MKAFRFLSGIIIIIFSAFFKEESVAFAYSYQQSTNTIQYYGQGSGSFEYKSNPFIPVVTITSSPPLLIYNYSSIPAEQFFNNPPYLFNSGSDNSYLITGNVFSNKMDPIPASSLPSPVLQTDMPSVVPAPTGKPIPESLTLPIPEPQEYQTVIISDKVSGSIAQPVNIENFKPSGSTVSGAKP